MKRFLLKGKELFSKIMILFFVLGCFSFSAIAQETKNDTKTQNNIFNHASWWRLDLSLEYGNNIFYASNLSVMNNNAQQTLYSSNMGFNAKYVIFNQPNSKNLRPGMFIGINLNQTEIPLAMTEKVNLRSYGLSGGFILELSHITSLDFNFGFGFTQYKNDFSLGTQNYSYKKNGLNGSVKSALYFSPVEYVKIGFGIEYRTYKFKNNDSMIDDFPSLLPTESTINAINPFISLKVSI
jgi:hypothetical protein